jgi:hypothetical protein
MLGIRDFGPIEGPMSAGYQPFGANMAFRRNLVNHLRFNSELGVVGKTWAGGEETSLFDELRRQGRLGVAVPNAIVRHFIPVANMRREHLWNWAVGWGRSVVRMNRIRGETPNSLPLWRLQLNLVRYYLRYIRDRALMRDRWVSHFYYVACLRGTIAELKAIEAPVLSSTQGTATTNSRCGEKYP